MFARGGVRTGVWETRASWTVGSGVFRSSSWKVLSHARLDRILSSAVPARRVGPLGQVRTWPGARHGRVAGSAASLPEVLVLHPPSREQAASRLGLAPPRSRGLAPGGSCP